jgi:hypothetical protein
VSSASSKVDDLANSGVRRVKAQALGVSSHEDARSDIPTAGGSGGHSRVGEWNTGGTKPRDLAAKSPEVLVFGFASHEVPRRSQPSIQRGHLAASRAISALRPSRLQHAKSSSVIFRCARCRENLGPGPTASPGEVRTVRSKRTRGARLSLLGISLIAISISKG